MQDGLIKTTRWEQVAETHWGKYVTDIERRAILLAQSLAGKPTRALEVGCEGGRWSKLLNDLGWEMTCIDVDQEMLAVCQQKIPSAKCLLTNPINKTIECDSNSQLLLLCVEVAPVIDSGWFLPESARILRNGGILVGVLLNKASIRGMINKMKTQKPDRAKSIFYNIEYRDYKTSLCQAGFQIVYEEGFCWGPFGRSSNSPLIPLATRVERLFRLNRMTTISPWIVFIARKVGG